MPTWKLEVEYEGTRYRGWQMQHNARSIQDEMSAAARELFEAKPEIFGACATDAGVHALRQIVHLKVSEVSETVTPRKIQFGFNDLLPADINVKKVSNAPDNFHARHDATAFYYLYQISARRTAFAKNFVWWIKDDLDPKAMAEAAKMLVGKNDFASFCETDDDDRRRSTFVEVIRTSVFLDGDLICFRIGAPYFLPKMVRRIVGMLVEVGRGNITYDSFARLLKFRSDTTAPFTAPPSGLFLENVLYADDEPPKEKQAIIRLP